MNEKQKRLYEVLLMPIEQENIEGFQIRDNIIYSNNTYGKIFDADMSNVAIEFYSALYGIDKEEIKNKDKPLLKGDTMNSSLLYYKPNSVEKKIEWDKNKHCLANFWLLPMDVGRTVKYLSYDKRLLCKHSKKSRLHDYMDNFLLFINENYKKYYEVYEEYFKSLNIEQHSFSEKFSEVHYLKDGYYSENKVKAVDKRQLKDGYEIWMDMIKARAQEIAVSNKWENLYKVLVDKKNLP